MEKISDKITAVLKGKGINLYLVRWLATTHRTLEVILTGESGPLDLNQVSAVTPLISQALDSVITAEEPYYLDIYSPQGSLPLITADHFQAVIGQEIEIVALDDRLWTGKLLAVHGNELVIKGVEEIKVALSAIKEGRQGGKR